jgi:hypothetical protein
MSESPESPESPTPRRTSRARLLIIGIVALALLVGLGAAAFFLRPDDEERDYPARWDPRVKPYVKIAEEERGLAFKHPVYVDFLEPKEFDKEVTQDGSDLSDEDRKDMAEMKDLLRSLDLVPADLDVLKTVNTMGSGGVIGLYSFDDHRIRVNGTSITPVVKSTLVHELTHALQDQHFDLGKHSRQLEDDDSGASEAYDALVEGDASRVETSYAEGLSRADQRALHKEERKDSREAEHDMASVPAILQTMMGAPYALGEALLDTAVALNGKHGHNDAVDALFAQPPSTEEHLLDPWSLLIDEEPADKVDEPTLPPGEKAFDTGTFGALGWYLVLSTRIPLVDALDAASGWGGDAYAAYRADGNPCIRIDFVGDTPGDSEQMAGAVRRWAAKGPRGAVTVRTNGAQVHLTSCASDRQKPVGSVPDDALALPLTRTYISIGALSSGAPPITARCVANEFVHRLPLDRLQGGFGSTPGDAAIRRAAWRDC